MMETQTVTSVTGKKSSPPENNTNESAEQNIDKNSLDEYEIVDNDLSDNVINLSEDLSNLAGSISDLSDNVINLSEDLSDNVAASVEHCNAFAETCDKPEADNESSKNTAHDLDLTLQKQKTEKQSEVRQIESLQMNRSSIEELYGEKDKLSHLNRAKDESGAAFDQRIYPVIFGLFVLVLLGFAYLELKWTQENWNKLGYYKASTEREIEDLKKSLDVEIKQRRKAESERAKAESELKLAQENLERLRLDNEKAENELKSRDGRDWDRPSLLKKTGEVDWLYCTVIGLALIGIAVFAVGFYSEVHCLFL